jgi:hypothetical protein
MMPYDRGEIATRRLSVQLLRARKTPMQVGAEVG